MTPEFTAFYGSLFEPDLLHETSANLLMIPIGKMGEWSSKYRSWRNFVFNSYHIRMMEMLEIIDNIAFNKMDEQLDNYLNDKIEVLNSKHIYTIHTQGHCQRITYQPCRHLKTVKTNGK